jgi:putative toxin-antitoxin system antitoxin component (TIGR02293 family)
MLAFQPNLQSPQTLWSQVGMPARGIKLHSAIHAGLPYEVYTKLAKVTGIDKKDIAQCIAIAPATLNRRAKAGKFTPDEGDKLYRLTEVLSAATDLFEGDLESAISWLKAPAKGLGGKRPLEMMSTSAESEAVMDLIGRLEHGVFV